jgi:hypothetical protein
MSLVCASIFCEQLRRRAHVKDVHHLMHQMCIHCELTMTDAQIEQMMQEQLSNPSFAVWNTTTVHQLTTAATGVAGADARDKALHLLEEFSAWRKTQPTTYTPSTGVEPMFSVDHIASEIAWLRAFQPPKDKHLIPLAARAFRLRTEQTDRDTKIGLTVFAGFVAFMAATMVCHTRGLC